MTVLFPFMSPSAVDNEAMDTLAAAVLTVPRFHASFESTGWFGTNVLWLDPKPATSFGALINFVAGAFPDYPPFEGRHDAVIPHLTVGHDIGPGSGLEEAEARVRECLPIHADVSEVSLWCGTDVPGGWCRMMGFPLG